MINIIISCDILYFFRYLRPITTLRLPYYCHENISAKSMSDIMATKPTKKCLYNENENALFSSCDLSPNSIQYIHMHSNKTNVKPFCHSDKCFQFVICHLNSFYREHQKFMYCKTRIKQLRSLHILQEIAVPSIYWFCFIPTHLILCWKILLG